MQLHQNQKPDILIIDEIFDRDFKDFQKDLNFAEAFKGIKVLIVERFGRTQFDLHKIVGSK